MEIDRIVEAANKAKAIRIAAVATVKATHGDAASQYVDVVAEFALLAKTVSSTVRRSGAGPLAGLLIDELVMRMANNFSDQVSQRLAIPGNEEISLLKQALEVMEQMMACNDECVDAMKMKLN